MSVSHVRRRRLSIQGEREGSLYGESEGRCLVSSYLGVGHVHNSTLFLQVLVVLTLLAILGSCLLRSAACTSLGFLFFIFLASMLR